MTTDVVPATPEALSSKPEGSLWTFDDVVTALHFVAVPTGIPLKGFSVDSRTLQPGQVFLALKGERYDGHDFLQQAYANGTALAIVEKGDLPILEGRSYLSVESTHQALWDLAVYARSRSQATVVAVSGSVGKTTVRSWIAQGLSQMGSTCETIKNFNGQVGLPLSLLRLSPKDRFGVFEIGVDAPGSMLPLAKICRPNVAVLTPVGSAHLETFLTPEAVAQEKAQLFSGLLPGGKVVCDAESCQKYPEILAEAQACGATDVVTVGFGEEASCRIVSLQEHASCTEIQVIWNGRPLTYTLAATGRAFALDSALAFVGVVLALFEGSVESFLTRHLLDIQQKVLSLTAQWKALPGRGRSFLAQWPEGKPITVIDDAYNANLASMLARLDVFDQWAAPHGGRKIAVVGDMLALGTTTEASHKKLFERLKKSSVDKVYAVGALSKEAFETTLPSSQKGVWLPSTEDLLDYLEKDLHRGDLVWFKASHAMGLSDIVDVLWQHRDEAQELAA